jgi:hypothetical protein
MCYSQRTKSENFAFVKDFYKAKTNWPYPNLQLLQTSYNKLVAQVNVDLAKIPNLLKEEAFKGYSFEESVYSISAGLLTIHVCNYKFSDDELFKFKPTIHSVHFTHFLKDSVGYRRVYAKHADESADRQSTVDLNILDTLSENTSTEINSKPKKNSYELREITRSPFDIKSEPNLHDNPEPVDVSDFLGIPKANSTKSKDIDPFEETFNQFEEKERTRNNLKANDTEREEREVKEVKQLFQNIRN